MKPFFIHFLYGATGEGTWHQIALVIAKNEDAAIRKFLKQGYLKHQKVNSKQFEEGVKYFSHGIYIKDFSDRKNDAEIQATLGKFFHSHIAESILNAEKHEALHEFYLTIYTNYS